MEEIYKLNDVIEKLKNYQYTIQENCLFKGNRVVIQQHYSQQPRDNNQPFSFKQQTGK